MAFQRLYNIFFFVAAIVLSTILSVSVYSQDDDTGEEDKTKLLNQIAAIELIGKTSLWEDTPEIFLYRIGCKIPKYDKSEEMIVVGSFGYFYSIRTEELRIYLKDGKISRLSIYFINKGDAKDQFKSSSKFARRLSNDHKKLYTRLKDHLGKAKRGKMGQGSGQTTVDYWILPDAEIGLEFSKREYMILHILPPGGISESAIKRKERQFDAEKNNPAENVRHDPDHDVWIDNIPMVDQGSKGYCVIATIERYFLYYGINEVDMHRLADLCGTNYGGGTAVTPAIKATENLFDDYGLTVDILSKLTISKIKKAIDAGYPIIWTMYSGEEYRNRLSKNTKTRKETPAAERIKLLKRKKKIDADKECPHLCFIIGYNEVSNEIAVSNSWGKHYSIQWISLRDAEKVDAGEQKYFIRPR